MTFETIVGDWSGRGIERTNRCMHDRTCTNIGAFCNIMHAYASLSSMNSTELMKWFISRVVLSVKNMRMWESNQLFAMICVYLWFGKSGAAYANRSSIRAKWFSLTDRPGDISVWEDNLTCVPNDRRRCLKQPIMSKILIKSTFMQRIIGNLCLPQIWLAYKLI
jgi:hypothetical protein